MNLRHYFALLFLILSCISTYTSTEFRIVGGLPWPIELAPHLVSIHYRNKNHCVGSLVTLGKVVTAASCVASLVNLQKSELIVAAGVTDLCDIPSAGQTSSVANIYVPCDYNPATKDMDIALMILRISFEESDTVQTIPFCGTELKACKDMRISGWGWKTPKNGHTSNTIQSIVLTTISQSTCWGRYTLIGKPITRTMICAARGRSDACYEDFGGPGVVDGELCAVVSHNQGCSDHDYPTVFTNLSNPIVDKFLKEAMVLQLPGIVINRLPNGKSP